MRKNYQYTLILVVMIGWSLQIKAMQQSSSSSSSSTSTTQKAIMPTVQKVTVIEQASNMRRLIMLFDFNFNSSIVPKSDAMSTALATALAQKSAPILVSKQLIYNFYRDISYYQAALDSFLSKDIDYSPPNSDVFGNYFMATGLTAQHKVSQLINQHGKDVAITYIFNKLDQALELLGGNSLIAQQATQSIESNSTQIQPGEWNIYTVDNLFYLLVPKSYVQAILSPNQTPTSATLTDIQTNQPFTRREQKLGLKVDKLTAHSNLNTLSSIQQFFLSVNKLKTSQSHKHFMQNKNEITQLLSKVLISKLDAPQQKESPVFNIYLAGHGRNSKDISDIAIQQKILANLTNEKIKTAEEQDAKSALEDIFENKIKQTITSASGTIASLPVTTHFAQLLDQLNYPYNTNSLTYLSCFAGGSNRQLSVYDIIKNILKIYNYTMTCSSATATTSSINDIRFMPSIAITSSGIPVFSVNIIFPQKLTKFFNELEQQATHKTATQYSTNKQLTGNVKNPAKVTSWSDILNNVIQFKDPETGKINSLSNIPLIRPRNTNKWFSISSSGKKEILELTPTRMTAFENEKTLNADNYATLLLSANHVPITIKMTQLIPIISKSAGNSSHVIKQLDAPTLGIDELAAKVFLPIRDLDDAKLFFIKQLEVKNSGELKNSLKTTGRSVILKNVLFLNNSVNPLKFSTSNPKKKHGIIFKYGNKYYKNIYSTDEIYIDLSFASIGSKSYNQYEDFYLDSIDFTAHGPTSPHWNSPGKVPRSINKFGKKIAEKTKVSKNKKMPKVPRIFNTPSPVKRSRKEYKTGDYATKAKMKRIESKEQTARFANMSKEERAIFAKKIKARHAQRAKKAKRKRTLFATPTKPTSATPTSPSSTSQSFKEHESPFKRPRRKAPKPPSTQLNTSFNDNDQNIIDEQTQFNTSFDNDDQDHGMPDA
ncbi:hypothetical protein HOL34_00955 [bacterium]|nr:hypothetical protein [bacterium]MBT3903499.1 hypothetical protein [bacterium]MBT4577993.1 hypothetical protein [bacterium]MBT5346222.1 hypothetical protein [bacterium]MBT6131018.1 hypothetical protein [bacterium]